jgi:DNA repair exonuclease SbcCD ATPase subunit
VDQSTKSRLALLKRNIQKAQISQELCKSSIDSKTGELEYARFHADLYAKCTEIFKSWLEHSIEQNVNSIAQLATEGLSHIISDQNLEFKIRQEHKNNRLWMRFAIDSDGVEGDPLHSFGGGAAMICSLVLRIAMMKRLGMCDLLLLDETMVAVSNAYVPSTAEFMRSLSEKTGINILMVTHNPEFLENANVAYEGSKDSSLKLRRIRKQTNETARGN